MIPNKDKGEEYSVATMKILDRVRVVIPPLANKWKCELFAGINENFVISVAERTLFRKLEQGFTTFKTEDGKFGVSDSCGNDLEVLALPDSFVPHDAEDCLLDPVAYFKPKDEVQPEAPSKDYADRFLDNMLTSENGAPVAADKSITPSGKSITPSGMDKKVTMQSSGDKTIIPSGADKSTAPRDKGTPSGKERHANIPAEADKGSSYKRSADDHSAERDKKRSRHEDENIDAQDEQKKKAKRVSSTDIAKDIKKFQEGTEKALEEIVKTQDKLKIDVEWLVSEDKRREEQQRPPLAREDMQGFITEITELFRNTANELKAEIASSTPSGKLSCCWKCLQLPPC